jgi:hypothetical protein
LAKRNKFATLVREPAFGYRGKVAWFWLFLKLHY